MKTFSFFSAIALATTLNVAPVHAATDVYVVTGVPSGEFLNMRSGAGTGNAITGRIPFNGQGVVTTGEEKKVNGTIWAKVYSNGVGGWVNKQYLLPEGKQVTVTPAKPAKPAVTPRKATPAKPAAPITTLTPRAITPRAIIVPPIKVPSYITLPKPAEK